MAIQTQGSIDIDRPVDEVFRLTNNHVAEWSMIVVEDEPLGEASNQVGAKFRTVTEENGRRMEFLGEVTRYDPPHLSAVHMTGSSFDLDVEYRFEELSKGHTRVTQQSWVHGKGFFKLFLGLFGWMMSKSSCQALDKELQGLKRFCESQPAARAS